MARVSGSPCMPSSRFIGEALGVTAETGSSGARATHYTDPADSSLPAGSNA